MRLRGFSAAQLALAKVASCDLEAAVVFEVPIWHLKLEVVKCDIKFQRIGARHI